MTASRTTNLIASGLISLAFAIVLFGAAQAITASAYSAPTYGSVMLDMGDEF